MSRSQKTGWEPLGKRILGWLTSPWKPTATVLAGLAVWYVHPILQSLAEEVLRALADPNSETDQWLRPIAAFSHRVLFVEFILICEIVLVGAIVVLGTKFAFYVANYILKSIRRWQRSWRGNPPRRGVSENRADGQLVALPVRTSSNAKGVS